MIDFHTIQDDYLLKDKKFIKLWLLSYHIDGYVINEDRTVDVDGDVDLSREGLNHIPVKFRNINGSLYVYANNLRNFIWAPEYIKDAFCIQDNKFSEEDMMLMTLKHGNVHHQYYKIDDIFVKLTDK